VLALRRFHKIVTVVFEAENETDPTVFEPLATACQ
jgi:hypothetical protein